MTSLLNKIIIAFLLLLSLSSNAQVLDEEGIPEKTSPPRLLNDFAQMLSISERENLEQKLSDYNDSTSTQICIVTLNTIGDYSIEDYALRLGRKWGVGQKDKDNGILILVAKEERKIDIEIGSGLEAHITDYDSRNIREELITPAFKQSNYYEGLDEAVDRIMAQLQGEFVADASNSDKIPIWVIILIIIIVLFIIIMINSGNSSISSGGGGWTWSSGGGSSWSGGGSSGGFSGFGGGSFSGGGSSGSW